MESYLQKDDAFQKAAVITRGIYALAGAVIAVAGALAGNAYRAYMGLLSLLIIPAQEGVYRIFRLRRGWQLETWAYCFWIISVTLGGNLSFYQKFAAYDKITHGLSGVFVAIIAFSMYLLLERSRPLELHNAKTAALFVFFASLAVAALFEIGEFALSPIVGRDLQNVALTGVTDTVTDMIACLVGTALVLPGISRFYRGLYEPFTGAAAGLFFRNPPRSDDGVCEVSDKPGARF